MPDQNAASRIQWHHAAEHMDDRGVMNSTSQPKSEIARRWTVIASGLLLLALALVVIYTGPNAFYSPVALVVVSAIGLAALLLQVWFRRDLPGYRSPLWLNVLGILAAMVSLFPTTFTSRPSRSTLSPSLLWSVLASAGRSSCRRFAAEEFEPGPQ